MNDTILLAHSLADFEEQIAAALKSLREGDLLSLGASSLAYTSLVEACFLTGEPVTTDGRGRILRSLLCWGIERMRPAGEPSWLKPAWRNYNILRHFYVEGLRASALAEAMAIAEQTLYQLRGQAIGALAHVVRSELSAPANSASRKEVVNTDRYARLAPQEQQLLRLAAVFPGAVPAHLLHSLAGTLGNPDAAAAAQQLALNHLMRSDASGREFVVHPELRPMLLTQLAPAERRMAHRVAAEHYIAQRNYLEAAQQWRAGEEAEAAAQLLIDHHRDMVDNLQIDELAQLIDGFGPGDLTPALWARLKILAGSVAEFTQNFDAALAAYQQALAAPDPQTKALAYYRRAKVFEQTNSDESLAHYTRAAQILERGAAEFSDERERLTLLCNVYIDRSLLQMQVRANVPQAEHDLLRAHALLDNAPALRDRPVWCDLHNALGEFYHRRGQPEQAVEHSWQAWLAANEASDLERMSKTAHNLGLVYMDNLRQYDRALEYLHKGEELARQTGNRQMEGLSAMSIGVCHYWLGDLPAAIQRYAAAAGIFLESGNRALLARTYFGLAEAHAERNERADARRYFDQGRTIALDLGDQGALHDFEALAQQYGYLLASPATSAHALSERQRTVLAYVQQHGQITNRAYQTLTGLSQKQTVRDLNELVAAKRLQRQGSGRATKYVLCE